MMPDMMPCTCASSQSHACQANAHTYAFAICLQVQIAADIIHNEVDPEASIIFGAVIDTTMPEDMVHITLIATGLGDMDPEFGALGEGRRGSRLASRPSSAVSSAGSSDSVGGVEIPAFLKRRRMQGMQ